MPTALEWAARLASAVLLGWTAGIHIYLYRDGYSTIHTIGPLFIVNGVVGSILCLAVLATPKPWLTLVALTGAGLELGTLLALIRALHGGIFGFQESTAAPLVNETIVVEALGTVVLGLLFLVLGKLIMNQRRSPSVTGA